MDERSRRVQTAFERPMLAATLLVVPVILVEGSSTHGALRTAAVVLNWLIWAAFVAEAAAMLYVVPERGRWLRHHPLEVAIILFTAPFLPASLQAARIFRLARLLRLVRLARLTRAVFSLEGLRFAAILTLITILGGGAVYVSFENRLGHPHLSLWDGVWWAVTTMTTVGYGDITPSTVGGRIVAMIVMVVGIGFVALLTGAVAQRFLSVQVAEIETTTTEVALAEAEILEEIGEISRRLTRLERAIRARQQPAG